MFEFLSGELVIAGALNRILCDIYQGLLCFELNSEQGQLSFRSFTTDTLIGQVLASMFHL